jgi:8-amino-7-oxononanoate synthase
LHDAKLVQLAAHLNNIITALFKLLTAASLPGLIIPSTCPNSPIFSIQTSQPKALAGYLQNRGMMVRAVVPPTVPIGTERVRICLHAGNTVEQIKTLVGNLESWAKSRVNGEHTSQRTAPVMDKNSKVMVRTRL